MKLDLCSLKSVTFPASPVMKWMPSCCSVDQAMKSWEQKWESPRTIIWVCFRFLRSLVINCLNRPEYWLPCCHDPVWGWECWAFRCALRTAAVAYSSIPRNRHWTAWAAARHMCRHLCHLHQWWWNRARSYTKRWSHRWRILRYRTAPCGTGGSQDASS